MGLADRWLGGATKGLDGSCCWRAGPIRYGQESVSVTPNAERAGSSGVEVLQSYASLVLGASSSGVSLDAGSLRRELVDRLRVA